MSAGTTTPQPGERLPSELSDETPQASALQGAAAEPRTPSKKLHERTSFYIWTAVVLAVAVTAVILGWHASGGTADPTDLPPGRSLSHTTVVINSAILVFREGLETILVLAAITASFLGANKLYRRPVLAGSGVAILASIGTWFLVIWFIGQFHGGEYDVQAATGLPALIVLLIVMNWFFHKVYWTGWISSHHKRRRSLLAADPETNQRRMLLGLALLGFTSVYREGFEIVIFLQNLREIYGSSVVLEGVAIGALFTAAAGMLTFALHQRLPYRRLLVITGVMLLFVLVVSVGEQVNEMQLAGWIGTTEITWLHIPAWMGTWFSLFNNWETFIGQAIALLIVLGSYVGAQYMRVWRPRRRGQAVARRAEAPPQRTPAEQVGSGEPVLGALS
ncbi:MAG TPA: FTR1 family protein [Solirubrobacteraceae bacterium]|jgi:high-affinity iron transporter|nr:FTR1 family protein [Solirubrobacteraceae bacterium]